MSDNICKKADFIDWKSNPVSKIMFETLHLVIYDLQEELGDSAGSNPIQDREKVGRIQALKEVLDWVPNLIEDEKTDDNADS